MQISQLQGLQENIGTQVGKKKTQDVQFYTEVMEVNQAIDAGRRSMYDPDELEEEQRERETRNRVSSDGISLEPHSCEDGQPCGPFSCCLHEADVCSN